MKLSYSKVVPKVKKKIFLLLGLFSFAFSALIFLGVISSVIAASQNVEKVENAFSSFSEEVKQYKPILTESAKQNNLSTDYVSHLMCIMQVETGGLGTDVMNAGAFESNRKYERKRGSIVNPNYSVDCGIKEFSTLLSLTGVTSIDDVENLKIVYQAYHTDRGYIAFAKKHGGYSPENAKQYLVEHNYPDYVSEKFGETVSFWYESSLVQNKTFIYPLTSHTISSPFGNRTGTFAGFHGGCDFPAPKGTPVYASADGIVITAGWKGTYGNCVMIKHSDTYTTLYGHNSSFNVHEGDTVRQGDIIAYVGSTGRTSGPHCHFEIRVNGERVDPIPFLEEKNKDEKK